MTAVIVRKGYGGDSPDTALYHLHTESLYHRFPAKAPTGKYRDISQTYLQARFVNPTIIPFAHRITISSISCKSPHRKISRHQPDLSPSTIRQSDHHTICTQNHYIIDFLQKPPQENIATSARPISKHDSSIRPSYHLHTESLYHRFPAKAPTGKYRDISQTYLKARFVNPTIIPFARRHPYRALFLQKPRLKTK